MLLFSLFVCSICTNEISGAKHILDQELGLFVARGCSSVLVATVTACLLCFLTAAWHVERGPAQQVG